MYIYHNHDLQIIIIIDTIIIFHIHIITKLYIFVTGKGCPFLRYLNKYVISIIADKWHDIGDKWYDIGKNLLDEEDIPQLKIIDDHYNGDVIKCTVEMLCLWLKRQPNPNWPIRLIQALKNTGVADLASKIEDLFTSGMHIIMFIDAIL